jgi:hypothetical protein
MKSSNNNNIGVGYGNVNSKPEENNQNPKEKYVEPIHPDDVIGKSHKEEKIILPDSKVIDIDEPAGKIHYVDFKHSKFPSVELPSGKIQKTPNVELPSGKLQFNNDNEHIDILMIGKKRMISRYTVIEYDDDGRIINTYENVYEAGYRLRITDKTVGDICRGSCKDTPYNLKYGEKERQLVELNYPEYTPQTLWDLKTNGQKVSGNKYIMRFTIVVYRYSEHKEYEEKNMLHDLSPIATYDHIEQAAKEMKLTEIAIQNIILKGYSETLNVVIEYGMRKRYTKRNLSK